MGNRIRNRLYEIRENLDLKQYTIAEMLGVNKRSYSFWETNDRFIPLKDLNTYCNKFNVSMDYVFYLTDKNEKTNHLDAINNVTLGKRIKEVCKENNLTQIELAKLLGTTQSTVSAYINGKITILTPFALQIAKTYNISLDWLCGRCNKKRA